MISKSPVILLFVHLALASHGCQSTKESGIKQIAEHGCGEGEPVEFHISPLEGEALSTVTISGRNYQAHAAASEKTAAFLGCLDEERAQIELKKVLFSSDHGVAIKTRFGPRVHPAFSQAVFENDSSELKITQSTLDHHSLESRGFVVEGYALPEPPDTTVVIGYRFTSFRFQPPIVDHTSLFIGRLEFGNPIGQTACAHGETQIQRIWDFDSARLQVALCSSVGHDQTANYRVIGVDWRDDNIALAPEDRGSRTLTPEEVREYARYYGSHHNMTDRFVLSLPAVTYRWVDTTRSGRRFFVKYGDGDEIDVTGDE